MKKTALITGTYSGFGKATDVTNQLRYVVTEDIRPLVKARHETSEEEYIALMRARFAPKS